MERGKKLVTKEAKLRGQGEVRLIAAGQFGHMVTYLNDHVGGVSIAKAVRTLRTVPPGGETVASARSVGISFGD